MANTLAIVQHTLRREAETLLALAAAVGDEVAAVVELLCACRGRLIVTGMGKSGCIARKAAGTFASTGTPALYLHPGEAWHGDLGAITSDDVVVALSVSGETEEVLRLIPYWQRRNIPLVAVTGRKTSSLGDRSQLVIELPPHQEADPDCPTPTCSTTALLAVCDALAVAVFRRRGLTRDQFALLHPGGHIGRKLLVTVGDLMQPRSAVPTVPAALPLRAAIVAMSRGGMGAVLVMNDGERLAGIFTDGDLRRTLERHDNPLTLPIAVCMTAEPKLATANELAVRALQRMETHSISLLPVVAPAGALLGVVRLHDLVKAHLV